MKTWLMRMVGARPVAALAITVITFAVIGGVIFAATPVACGPAQKAGLRLQQCSRPVASRGTPTPVGFPSPSSTATPPYTPPASEPYTPPASEPYTPPASGYCPPDSGPNCGASGPYPPPGPGPASGSYPPFAPPATGPNGSIGPTLTLNCRLPMYVGPSGSGGFVVFPGGTYVSDPTSAVTLPAPPPGSPQPLTNGPGGPGLDYDSAFSKWLPVGPNWVSPDGAHYVFQSQISIYVVDVRSNALTEVGQGHQWNIVGVADDAVYAEVASAAGLWKLSFSGTSVQVATVGFWQIASSKAAYGTQSSALPSGVTNTIIKLDLSSGQIDNNFYSREGTTSYVAGLDHQGNPIVSVSYFAENGGGEVWLVTAVGATPLFGSGSGSYYNLTLAGTPIADAHGVWFPLYVNTYPQGLNGFALYVPGKGLYWMSGVGGLLAGGCLP